MMYQADRRMQYLISAALCFELSFCLMGWAVLAWLGVV